MIPKKNKEKKRQSMADRRLLPPAHYENLSANSSLTEDMDIDFPALADTPQQKGGTNSSIYGMYGISEIQDGSIRSEIQDGSHQCMFTHLLPEHADINYQ